MGMVMDGWRPIESVLGVLVTYEKTLLTSVAVLLLATGAAHAFSAYFDTEKVAAILGRQE